MQMWDEKEFQSNLVSILERNRRWMGGDGQDYDDDSDLKPLKIHFILEQLAVLEVYGYTCCTKFHWIALEILEFSNDSLH